MSPICLAVYGGQHPMKVTLLGIVVLSLVVGCRQQPSAASAPTSKQTATMRTDAAPITGRLPRLGLLQAVWWTSTQVTTDSALSPPANPAYQLVGFAQLEKGNADELSQQFQWQQMPPDWKPALTVTNLNLDSAAAWSQSPAFTKDCKP